LRLLRERVAWALRYMEEKGLNYGYSGNVSARAGPGAYLITPSGVRKAEVKPEDLPARRRGGAGRRGRR
jgi:L-fuculose-phosphate aldolase